MKLIFRLSIDNYNLSNSSQATALTKMENEMQRTWNMKDKRLDATLKRKEQIGKRIIRDDRENDLESKNCSLKQQHYL
jgi:hypothetical protein